MRIAMFTNNYKPFIAGVPISIERLAEGLRELGHTVYIFAPDYGKPDNEEGVIRYRTIYQKKSGVMVGNCFDRKVEKLFRQLDFDVIHVHHPVLAGHEAMYLSKKYGVPIAYTYHTRYEQYLHYLKPFQAMERRGKIFSGAVRFCKEALVPGYMALFANRCDLVFAPTETMRTALKQSGVETRTAVLPTGLPDSAFFGDHEKAMEIRKQYAEGKKYLFCTVSRLEQEKNLDFLLDGIVELKKRIGDCFRVMVIGEGSLMGHLKERAENEGIGSNVVFIGKVSNQEIVNYQSASDVFLFASKSETQGIVLLEAMASGSPVAAVEASGVTDVVENGCNGYMTRESAGEWAQAVCSIVENEDKFRQMKENAAGTASRYQSWRIAKEAQHRYVEMAEQYRQNQERRQWSLRFFLKNT